MTYLPNPYKFYFEKQILSFKEYFFKKIVKDLLGYFTLILFPVPMDSSKCKKKLNWANVLWVF